MRNKFKKALFCAALAVSSSAFASGPLDGAYDCRVSWPGMSAFTAWIVVVTDAHGVSAVAPISVTTDNRIFGYALGTATTTSFTGLTDLQQPFSWSVNPQTLSFSGNFGILVRGAPLPAFFSCNKIF